MRYKASTCKATLDIPLYYRGEEGFVEAIEEFELAYVADMHLHQVFNLVTVRLL